MDDDFDDNERDNRGSVDPSGYAREAAEAKSRNCPRCKGQGLAPIYDFEYDGAPVVVGIDDMGNSCKRVGRTVAYCVCLFGRWIQQNHRDNKASKDVYDRIPDLADVIGQPSFWLENDPTARDATDEEIDALPASWRNTLAARMRVNRNHHP